MSLNKNWKSWKSTEVSHAATIEKPFETNMWFVILSNRNKIYLSWLENWFRTTCATWLWNWHLFPHQEFEAFVVQKTSKRRIKDCYWLLTSIRFCVLFMFLVSYQCLMREKETYVATSALCNSFTGEVITDWVGGDGEWGLRSLSAVATIEETENLTSKIKNYKSMCLSFDVWVGPLVYLSALQTKHTEGHGKSHAAS